MRIWCVIRRYKFKKPQSEGQTRNGITLGSNKYDVIKKLDGMYLSIQPNWRYDEKPDKARYSLMRLSDGDNGTELFMYFEENIPNSFFIGQFEGLLIKVGSYCKMSV